MIWLDTHLVTVVISAAALLATLFVLQQRRTPQSAAAWLLFIVVVPWLALPLFLMLGFRKQGSRYPAIPFTGTAASRADPAGGPAEALRAFGIPAACTGSALHLHRDGQEAWEALLALVDSATSRIDVTLYLIENDAVGRDLLARLEARAAEGIAVRLLVDELGGFLRPRGALRALSRAGGEVRTFSPLLRLPSKGHFNLRNHRKTVIADNTRVWAGGRNAGASYLGPEADPTRWDDISYTLEGGAAVRTIDEVFRSDWATAGGNPPEPAPEVPPAPGATACVQPVPSGPDVRGDPFHDVLVQMIHAATSRVWIHTPYFLPTEGLGAALATAARRGVDVRITVPDRSNHRVTDFARGGYLRALEDAGATILRRPTMSHAKMAVIDAAAWTGSPNVDIRSMLLNFELALFVYDAPSVAWLANWYEASGTGAQRGLPPASFWRRLAEGVFRLGAPLL
ncbi:phospholipase D-like domain-containing protein [Pseudoroseicyclus aestuarii]|uniref:Phospholipase D n=1 Tax=Pseudoroseicyclus aestuarii TaxID=1795041 RepID=A0A318SXW2_9RHOB|nr:phospholipase D-like domain-containing protein [Pseudoroseicyclus aestuarii]PYE86155.1 cardiolipin synthetase 2 [Pseudoroseicyclus aestuarii]